MVFVEEAGCPEDRVAVALKCLLAYDSAGCWNDDLAASFRYWKIRDFAYAYRAKLTTPSMVRLLIDRNLSFMSSPTAWSEEMKPSFMSTGC